VTKSAVVSSPIAARPTPYVSASGSATAPTLATFHVREQPVTRPATTAVRE
jgi:hypothetical protein